MPWHGRVLCQQTAPGGNSAQLEGGRPPVLPSPTRPSPPSLLHQVLESLLGHPCSGTQQETERQTTVLRRLPFEGRTDGDTGNHEVSSREVVGSQEGPGEGRREGEVTSGPGVQGLPRQHLLMEEEGLEI